MVWTAIMAKFKRTTRPSALTANKISMVKRKGKSPTFLEQKSATKYAPKAADTEDPSPQYQKKPRHCGGKGRKRGIHAIVSSALIPETVAHRMQETHMQAPTTVAAPPLQIVIGGLSHAPVSVATTVASFKPSGVSCTKVPPPVVLAM